MNSKQRLRTRIVGGGVLVIAAVLVFSLYSTSIIKGDTYATRAQSQYAKPDAALFSRGNIYFLGKDGVPRAAASVDGGYLVHMNPKLVTDPKSTYDALSHYIKIDKVVFMAKAAKTADPYEELLNRVDEQTAKSIQGLGLKGIGISQETWRSYPGNTLAAHVLGIIGQSSATSSVAGRYGLERSYDKVLRRDAGGGSINIFAEIFSGFGSVFSGSDEAGNLITTIEPTVQAYLEKVMSTTEDSWNPDEIGGIIMDPHTGEIHAMASHPTYNPNELKSMKSAAVFSNPLVEHVYEMGSIVKPITMAVALDSGAVTVNSTYDDTGCTTLNEKKICNFDQRARGVIPMQQILSQSLNMGAATIALKVGGRDFSNYFNSFGFNTKTGIDLPAEASPLLNNLKNPSDIDVATASYGQGIAVSPIGITRALSVLANGGYLVTPHVVKHIENTDGTIRKIEIKKEGPILKPQTVEDVKRMLIGVVDTALANGSLKRDHYTIAAKTGTAAIADHENGGYYSDRYLHSFFGFFPAYNPRYIVFLYQIHPKGAKYASETLVKPFDDLAGFLINYYNIAPDR